MEDLKRKMHERVEKSASRLHRMIDKEVIGGEEGRLWLEQFCKGKGLDIACGDFLVSSSIGIDLNPRKLGKTWIISGDEILKAESESMDYIVSNYFDCFPNPLKALHEWYRVLKKGGTIGIVCPDAESYIKQSRGPLKNLNKVSAFTKLTLKQYISRAGFSVEECFSLNNSLHFRAVK